MASHSKSLRTDVPAYPGPPDRAQWEREHGVKPFPIDPASFAGGGGELGKFEGQAKATVARDWKTLDRDDAINQQEKLEHVCFRVKLATKECQERDHVFFDPQDGKFWVYPEGPRAHARDRAPDRNILDATEERLNAITDPNLLPYQIRLPLRDMAHVRIAGYTHLPVEQQLVKWAEHKGWHASISWQDNTLVITKPKRPTLGESLGKELPHANPESDE